jgi:glycine/D-amino acid oxidase-like deaminating enzyme
VTGASFAWIGGPGGRDAPDASTPLRRSVLQDWRRLERDVPEVRVRWTGSLAWGDDALRNLEALGPDEQVVDEAEVRRLEPNLRLPPERAVFRSTDGAVDPVGVTEGLLRAARTAGADVRAGVTVTRLVARAGALVGLDTSTGFMASPTVVLATGVGTSPLCAPLGVEVPVASSPALLARFTAPAQLIRTLVTWPQEARQAADGQVLVPRDHRGETTSGDLWRAGQDAARLLADTFTSGEDARLIDVRVGHRPMPVDGLPIIGPLPGLAGVHVAVMHSAITLGPTVGRLVAAELLTQSLVGELAGVRPDRFAATAR